jgi:hypothetical protein
LRKICFEKNKLQSANLMRVVDISRRWPGRRLRSLAILQKSCDVFTSGASSLEPGRICMILSLSQTAPSRPMLVQDARWAL